MCPAVSSGTHVFWQCSGTGAEIPWEWCQTGESSLGRVGSPLPSAAFGFQHNQLSPAGTGCFPHYLHVLPGGAGGSSEVSPRSRHAGWQRGGTRTETVDVVFNDRG